MQCLWFYLFVIGLTINCAATRETPITPESRENLNKIAALYAGVPSVESYAQTKDFIIKLEKPDQNLAQQAKAKGVVMCYPLINEQAEVEFIYFKNSINPVLDSAVTEALKASMFKTYEEVIGKKGKYSLLLHFPFYPSKIDLNSLPKTDKNKVSIAKEDATHGNFDKPPEPVAGFGAIHKNLQYPKIARKAGMEGKVTIMFAVDKEGNVGEFIVAESSHPLLVEAAIETIRSLKWKPAEINGKPTGTWLSIPFVFRLK